MLATAGVSVMSCTHVSDLVLVVKTIVVVGVDSLAGVGTRLEGLVGFDLGSPVEMVASSAVVELFVELILVFLRV